MIQITRTSPPDKLVLEGGREKDLAIEHFEVYNNQIAFEFKAYSRTYVKEALKELFNKKCAYCESYLTHIEHPHIEHWRPKGKVTEDITHRGYYWLAADWGNLFLACGVCNSSYKLNKFPLKDGSEYARLSSEDIHILERPLLVNPCNDNPEQHLDFTCKGEIIGVTHEGEKSIEVYGLDREDLTYRRKFFASSLICSRLDDILEDIYEFKSQPSKLMQRVNKKINELNIFVSSNAEYSAMNKCIVKEYRERYTNRFFLELTNEIVSKSME